MSFTKGSEFPADVKFPYIPYDKEAEDINACGFPIQLDVSKEIANKKVVIVAVPGAFTPACSEHHIPPYAKKLDELKSKGVDELIIISANDPFVLSAWGKALGLYDKAKFATDPLAKFSKPLGLSFETEDLGLGLRLKRYALVVDHGKVTYLGVEEKPSDVNVSSVDAVLKNL